MRILATILLAVLTAQGFAATTGLKLAPEDRESIGLTVYEGGFAVVREVKRTILPLGLVEVDYEGVPRAIDPSSVRVVSITDPAAFTLLEQSYHLDVISRDSLLEHFVGQKVKYVRSILQGAAYEKILREGVLLAVKPEVVDFGDEIEIQPEGVISLPYIPAGLRRVPTLVWRLDNNIRGAQRIETSYIVDEVGWTAEYNLEFDEAASTVDVSVWVELYNRSGGAFKDASLSLVAGQVKRVRNDRFIAGGRDKLVRGMMMTAESDAPGNIEPQTAGDYHVFHLPDPVTLSANEQSQIHLLSIEDVPVERRYVLERQVPMHQMQEALTDRFDIQFSIENVNRHGLGQALPAGKVRVYSSGQETPLLLGEDVVSGTPKGERLEMTIGKAFDLVAERTQKSYRRTTDRTTEVGYEISVRNHKTESATVILREMFSGDWTIVSQTESGKRINSREQEYVIELGPGASRTFEYTARIRF